MVRHACHERTSAQSRHRERKIAGRGVCAKLRRCLSAAHRAPGAGRKRSLLLLLRRALRHCVPYGHRHSEFHPQDRHRQLSRARPGTSSTRTSWAHLRARLPDRGAVRKRVRARDCRGQAGRHRRAAALCHRLAVRAEIRSSITAAPRPASASRSSAADRPGLHARTGWRRWVTRSRCSTHVRSSVDSTNTASPRTRSQAISRSARSTTCSPIGGIKAQLGQALGRDVTLDAAAPRLRCGLSRPGLGGVRALDLDGEGSKACSRRSTTSRSCARQPISPALPIGRRVVVIGGGMTAIDIATQTKLLGAEEVTIVYRRGAEQMGASRSEQEWAQTQRRRHPALGPTSRLLHDGDRVCGVEFETTQVDAGGKLVADVASLRARRRHGVQGNRPEVRRCARRPSPKR